MTYEQKDLLQFAEDLFSDMINIYPIFYDLRKFPYEKSSSIEKIRNYDSVIGKCVIKMWQDLEKILITKLRRDFPRFCKTEDNFKKYLNSSAQLIMPIASDVHDQILMLSATLLGIISFLYRRGVTHFIYSAPYSWLLMFKHVNHEEFQKQGSWEGLKVKAKKETEEFCLSSDNDLRDSSKTLENDLKATPHVDGPSLKENQVLFFPTTFDKKSSVDGVPLKSTQSFSDARDSPADSIIQDWIWINAPKNKDPDISEKSQTESNMSSFEFIGSSGTTSAGEITPDLTTPAESTHNVLIFSSDELAEKVSSKLHHCKITTSDSSK